MNRQFPCLPKKILTNTNKRRLTGIIRVLIALALVLTLLTVTTSASSMQDVPYQSYTYDYNGDPVINKACYVPRKLITGNSLGIEDMKEPQSIFYVPQNNNIYILDSGNSRVIVLNQDYTVNRLIDNITLNGEKQTFEKAENLFISHEGKLYISDTEGRRVLVCNNNGIVEKVLDSPKTELLPKNFDFRPMGAIEDRKGFIYVLSRGSYYGAMIYKKDGSFFGFYGANKVGMDSLELIGQILDRLFSNDELRATGIQSLPYQFTELCLGPDDFIYTLTSVSKSSTGQVRKLSPNGENILTYRSILGTNNADSFDFSDRMSYVDRGQNLRKTTFADIDVDEQGFIYLLDSTYGKIFIYDSACNPITIFGGGVGRGTQLGTFEMPVSLVNVEGDILVVDSTKGSITVFEPTPYFELIRQADRLYLQGNYAAAMPLWGKVHSQDKNFLLAYNGIAQGYLVSQKYDKAMEYARYASSRTIYTQAFLKVRNTFLSDNFFWLAPLSILLIAAILLLVMYTSRRRVVLISNVKLRTMMTTITHPINAFNEIKYKRHGSLGLAFVLMALYSIFSILAIINGGFMFNIYEPEYYNAVFTVIGTSGLILLWTVVNWGVSSLMEGKGRMKEIFIITCYAMLPQIFSLVLFIAMSHVLVPDEGAFMEIIKTVCNIWTIILILFGMTAIHDFEFGKTIKSSILTVLGMALLVFITLMVSTLFQDFINFIGTVISEIVLRKNV